jgi:hypothetical protein
MVSEMKKDTYKGLNEKEILAYVEYLAPRWARRKEGPRVQEKEDNGVIAINVAI